MSTKLSHPYKDHPEPWQWPEERKDEISELYQWYVKNQNISLELKSILDILRMIKQPRFPTMTKNHVHQFYHACIYDKEETKKAFHRYVEVRKLSSSLEKSLFIEIFSFERQLPIALASVIRFYPRFNLFITLRKLFKYSSNKNRM